jgi:hypothetical protein
MDKITKSIMHLTMDGNCNLTVSQVKKPTAQLNKVDDNRKALQMQFIA